MGAILLSLALFAGQGTNVDWANVGNDKGGMRYSGLTQINRKTVKDLKPSWTYNTGDAEARGTTIECTPIVVDGVMYITTVKLKVVALNAATGKPIWEYDTKARGVNRGVAYWSNGNKRRIISATPDGKMVSLDARTGTLDASFGNNGVVELRDGMEGDLSKQQYGSTSAPAIFENLIIVPIICSEGQPGAPGDIRAFNVETGKPVWRFRTVPQPGEFGNETWTNGGWKDRSGTNAWSGYTLDVKNGIVFAGIGSAAADFYGGDRLGENLFANSTVALDARTGERKWHFQTVHHDLWDHDLPCPPVVCTVTHKGKKIEAVAQPTKTGYIFVFDRKTGKPLFEVKEVPTQPSDLIGEQAWPTQPIPVKPPALSPTAVTEFTDISPAARDFILEKVKTLRYGKQFTPPSVEGTLMAPGFHGGATWSGASVDPETGILYINTNNVPCVYKMKKNDKGGYDFQGYDFFSDQDGRPGVKPPWGHLTAVNLNTGKFAWRNVFGEYPDLKAKGMKPTGTQNFGGTIVTAGGLVFVGATMDEKFRAFDKANGRLLWEYQLPAGGYATPSTYMVNGKQYVVIACGGGGKLGTKSGDSFIGFALP